MLLDDHHDSDKINEGLAAEAGYVGTFGAEAEESLDELRRTFLRKAHTAAMERCVSALLRREVVDPNAIHQLTLRDLPDGRDEVSAAAPAVRPRAQHVPEQQGRGRR